MPLVGTSSQNAAADFRQFVQLFARVLRWWSCSRKPQRI